METLFELIKDVDTPEGLIRAGVRKTEKEWRKVFPRLVGMQWANEWFFDITKADVPPPDDAHSIVNEVFRKAGLRSLSYKEAAVEACRKYARHLQLKLR